MVGPSKTWDFGPSLMTADMIEELRKLGCFGEAKVKPPEGETVPKPQAADAVVFRDFFLCGLRFPAARFLHESWKRSRYNFTILPPMVLLS